MALSSYGGRENIGAQFLAVGTQTLKLFVQLRPHQPIEYSPLMPKQWKHSSTAENRLSIFLQRDHSSQQLISEGQHLGVWGI